MSGIPLPPEFDICLSNACNMACGYCYWSRQALAKPLKLTFEQIARGLGLYLAGRKSGIEKISIAGGEPFLDFPLLERVVRHVRREAGPGVELELFTNGTMLTRDRARALLAHGARIIVSLDGASRTTDRYRRFRDPASSPVSGAVLENLASLGPSLLGGMCAGATFTSATAADVAGNVRFLRNAGFGEVLLDVDILEAWDAGGLRRLKAGLAGLRALYTELALNSPGGFGKAPVGLDFLFSEDEKNAIRDLPSFRELSLAPDGCFYPSGLVSAQGPARAMYRLGSLDEGIDRKRTREVLCEVKDYFSRARYKGYAACPVNLYLHSRVNGKDPAVLLASGESVYLSSKSVLPLVESARVGTLLETSPDFGDFGHAPRHVCRSAPAAARLGTGSGAGPGTGLPREAVDALLYSAGRVKELRLPCALEGPGFERAECLSMYALLKAARLGKDLRVALEPGPGERPGAAALDFISEHGLFLRAAGTRLSGWPSLAKSRLGARRVWVELDAGSPGWARAAASASGLGFSHFTLRAGSAGIGKGLLEKRVLELALGKKRVYFADLFPLVKGPVRGGGEACAPEGRPAGAERACPLGEGGPDAFAAPLFRGVLGKLLLSAKGRAYVRRICREASVFSRFHGAAACAGGKNRL